MSRCFYFGCWNQPGHFLVGPDGHWVNGTERREYYGDRIHLDGTLAPRISKRTNGIVWAGMAATQKARLRITYDSEECEQGRFLRHMLDSGFTAIQWWDRCQGDTRGACNSTVLLEGNHTTEEMLAALRERFPHVLANLAKHGIELVEIIKQ